MLKVTITLLSLVGLAAVAAPGADPDPEPPDGGKAELKKLKGEWTVTSAVFGGREMKAPPGMTYTFDGDKLTRTTPFGKAVDGRKQTFKVKLDTKKKPHTIELIPEGKAKGQA